MLPSIRDNRSTDLAMFDCQKMQFRRRLVCLDLASVSAMISHVVVALRLKHTVCRSIVSKSGVSTSPANS